jgi:hypothetical protein
MTIMTKKRRWLTLALGALAVCTLIGLTVQGMRASAQIANDPDAALNIIAHLNAWRLEAGMWPLKPNEILNALALDQASYLSTLADIPSGNAMHVGRNGEGAQ